MAALSAAESSTKFKGFEDLELVVIPLDEVDFLLNAVFVDSVVLGTIFAEVLLPVPVVNSVLFPPRFVAITTPPPPLSRSSGDVIDILLVIAIVAGEIASSRLCSFSSPLSKYFVSSATMEKLALG